jgi:hypothetical protein
MDIFASVFLHMNTRETDTFLLTVVFNINIAVLSDRQLIHADLIAFGQVWIKITLARPAARVGDLAVSGDGGANSELDDATIDDRQDAGKAGAHGAGVMVGGHAKFGRTATKIFDFVCNCAWTSKPMTVRMSYLCILRVVLVGSVGLCVCHAVACS